MKLDYNNAPAIETQEGIERDCFLRSLFSDILETDIFQIDLPRHLHVLQCDLVNITSVTDFHSMKDRHMLPAGVIHSAGMGQ